MMQPWFTLNARGKLLYCLALLNLGIGALMVAEGSLICIFSALVAMFCGLGTFDPRCREK